MENNTEVIQQQMTDTRAALSEKLEALEEQVLSTVQDTTENVAQTVEDTVETVKETVADTVSTVQETVQETVETVQHAFDLRRHVENYPWAMFAGAVVVGYLGTQLLTPSAAPAAPATGTSTPPQPTPGSTFAPTTGSTQALFTALGPALDKLKELAIGTTAGLIGDMLLSATPETLRESVTEVIDQITTSLGGKPVHGLVKQDSKEQGKDGHQGDGKERTEHHHSEAEQLRR